MKTFLKKLLPNDTKDIYFWFLFVLALFPIIYMCLEQIFDYMMFNFALLCVIGGYLLFKLIQSLVFKRKINLSKFVKSPAFILLLAMAIWLFIGSFFSKAPIATWFGEIDDKHVEQSIFQHVFYFMVAVCAIKINKENLKHLFYVILAVINIIILIQFIKQDYGYAFINRNHTGYYLCVTVSITIGMLLHSKNIWEIVALSISLIMHFMSFVLNHSLGPVIGLIAFFIIAFIYYLIKNRKVLIRLSAMILSCVAVFSFFDFVPKVKDLRSESTPVFVQLRDVGLVVLNKTGIISDEKLAEIINYYGGELTQGSDGFDRLDMWKVSIDNMLDYPIFGVGAGAWYSYNEGMPNRAPHNEFLEYGAIGGVPALLLYLSVFVYLFIMFRKRIKQQSEFSFLVFGAIITYLVQSIFGNVLPFTAPVFYLMIGLAIKFIDFNEEPVKEAENLQQTKTEENQEMIDAQK